MLWSFFLFASVSFGQSGFDPKMWFPAGVATTLEQSSPEVGDEFYQIVAHDNGNFPIYFEMYVHSHICVTVTVGDCHFSVTLLDFF